MIKRERVQNSFDYHGGSEVTSFTLKKVKVHLSNFKEVDDISWVGFGKVRNLPNPRNFFSNVSNVLSEMQNVFFPTNLMCCQIVLVLKQSKIATIIPISVLDYFDQEQWITMITLLPFSQI